MDGEFVVNDALGLAQYITQHLDENRSVAYLSSINALTLEDWNFAKTLVKTKDKSQRRCKEASIRDIVFVFRNEDTETKYLVANLGLCAGFQTEFLALANYTASSIEAAKSIASQITAPHPYSLYSPEGAGEREHSSAGVSTESFPYLNGESSEKKGEYRSFQTQEKRQWPRDNVNRGYVRGNNKNNNNQKSSSILPNRSRSSGLQGTGTSRDGQQRHQSKFICLGIRSGSDETVQTLTKELEEKWKGQTSLTVEAVSKTEYSSTFRVQMQLPAMLYNKLENSNMWPARMSAFRWKGNPRTPLKPLEERSYTKKIYIGNLHKNVTTEKVIENVKQIYQNEIMNKTIHTVDAIINYRALERANQIVSMDQSRELRQSMCVILTSHPGMSLMNVPLKLDHYPQHLRRSVRPWRGASPRQEETIAPAMDLEW